MNARQLSRVVVGWLVCMLVIAGAWRASGATIVATSASRSDVQAAINATSTGDTVRVPAGFATWSDNILGVWRGITLQGAGTNATVITLTRNDQAIYVQPGIGSSRLRITGFTFNGHDNLETVIAVNGPASAVRVDNCHFNKGRRAVTFNFYGSSGPAIGVVDHCSFRNMDHPVYPFDRRTTDGSFQGNVAWNEWISANDGVGYVGTTNVVFFEDNHFIWNTGLTLPIAQGAVYGQAGGKVVFRYNKCNGLSPYMDAHGDGIGSGVYGATLYEIYKNTFAEDNWYQTQGNIIWMRGGTALCYSNVFTGVSIPFRMSVYFTSDIHRVTNTFYWANTWNGSTTQSSQVRVNDSGQTPPGYSAANIVEGTHYWLAAPTVGQKYYPYTAAPYPHPLTQTELSTVSVQSSTYSVNENVTPLTITLTRTGGSGAVSVNYATANGTAIAGVNYSPASGTINWGDGDFANKTIPVTIINDGVFSSDLTFTLALSGPVNAVLGSPNSTTVTIQNVNPPPIPPLMAGLAFKLNLGTITAPAQTNASGYLYQTVDTDDPANAGCSTVRVTIPYAATWRVRGGVIATNTAQNSGYVDFSTNIVATEAWHIPVTTGSTPEYRIVSWIGNGTSTPQFPTNTWELNADVYYFQVCCREANTQFDDVIIEPAYPGTIQLAQDVYSVNEDAGTVTLTVRRVSGDDGPVGITYKTSNGTAQHGVNYTGVTNTLSWANGDTADKIIVVTVLDDGVYGPDLTFNLTLSDPTGNATMGTPSAAVVTILNVDPPPTPDPGLIQFTTSAQSINENMTPLTVVVRRADGADGPVGISYETQDATAVAGVNYAATSGTLSWLDTDMADKSFTVPIINDGVYGPDLDFRVRLHTPTGGAALGTQTTNVVTILNVNPAPSQFLLWASTNVFVMEDGQQTAFQIARQGDPTGTVTVDFYTEDGTAIAGTHYVPTNGTASLAAGVLTYQIPVTILDNAVYGGDKAFSIVLTNVSGAIISESPAANGFIIDDEIEQSVLWVSGAFSTNESTGPLRFSVRRLEPSGNVSVDYQTIDGTARAGIDYVGSSGTLTMTGSEDMVGFSVDLIQNPAWTGGGYFTVRLSNPANANIIGQSTTLGVIVDAQSPPSSAVRIMSGTYRWLTIGKP